MKKMIAAEGLPYTERISKEFPTPAFPEITPTRKLTPEIIEKLTEGLESPRVSEERRTGEYSTTAIYDGGTTSVVIKHLPS